MSPSAAPIVRPQRSTSPRCEAAIRLVLVLACLLGSARAGQAAAQASADAPPPSEPSAAPAAAAAPTPEAPDDALQDADTDLTAPEAPAVASSRGVSGVGLDAQLRELNAEREGTTNLWPWVTVAVGAVTTVASTAVGVAGTFDCKGEDCFVSAWTGIMVCVGATIATAGAIWLVHTDANIAEIERKQRQIEGDIDNLERTRTQRQLSLAPPRAAPGLSLRLSF